MNVTFFFPYKILSGVPITFSNFANKLADKGHQVNIIDYEDGVLWINTNKSVNKIAFIDDETTKVNDDSVLVLQSLTMNSLRKELVISNTQKILFWQLHPNNYHLNYIFKIDFIDKIINSLRFLEKKKINSTIKKIDELDGLVFMDGANYISTQNLVNFKLKKNFLPIIVNENRFFNKIIPFSSKINISYIGRICDFKFFPLLKLIDALNKLSEKYNFQLFIYGDGPLKSRLVKETNDCLFKIYFKGAVDNNNLLNQITKDNININFAMGTSVLDSSFIGIPSVVLNFFYDQQKGFPIYKWIYEEQNFSVGKEIFHDDFKNSHLNTLEDIFDSLEKNYHDIVKFTKKYYFDNYSSKIVVSKMEEFLSKTKLKYKDIKKIHKKNFIRKLYETLY